MKLDNGCIIFKCVGAALIFLSVIRDRYNKDEVTCTC